MRAPLLITDSIVNPIFLDGFTARKDLAATAAALTQSKKFSAR